MPLSPRSGPAGCLECRDTRPGGALCLQFWSPQAEFGGDAVEGGVGLGELAGQGGGAGVVDVVLLGLAGGNELGQAGGAVVSQGVVVEEFGQLGGEDVTGPGVNAAPGRSRTMIRACQSAGTAAADRVTTGRAGGAVRYSTCAYRAGASSPAMMAVVRPNALAVSSTSTAHTCPG
jgi:hypothetical protein